MRFWWLQIRYFVGIWLSPLMILIGAVLLFVAAVDDLDWRVSALGSLLCTGGVFGIILKSVLFRTPSTDASDDFGWSDTGGDGGDGGDG